MPLPCLNWMSSDSHTSVTWLLHGWWCFSGFDHLDAKKPLSPVSDFLTFACFVEVFDICLKLWVWRPAHVEHGAIASQFEEGKDLEKEFAHTMGMTQYSMCDLDMRSASCILKLTRIGQCRSYTLSLCCHQNKYEVISTHVFFGRWIKPIKSQQMRLWLLLKCYYLLPRIVCHGPSKNPTLFYQKGNE